MKFSNHDKRPVRVAATTGKVQRANAAAPGKRPRTMSLPPHASVQRKVGAEAAPPPAQESAQPIEDWSRVVLRPDLHQVPELRSPVQRKAAQGLLSGLLSPSRDAPIQAKGGHGAPDSSVAATGSGKAMPADVRGKMEGAFGMDLSAVRIHEGPQAPAIGALAFTRGTDVHFAPGQYDPHSQRGQELLGHELAHVKQQAEGRVPVTTQAKGLAINDDAGLEREADEMGRKAAQGQAVAAAGPATSAAQGGVSQRAAATPGGSPAPSLASGMVVQRSGPPLDSELGMKAAKRGAELEEMTTLGKEKGYYAASGSMAADPKFETNAQVFEDRLGKKAMNDPVARTCARVLAETVRGLIADLSDHIGRDLARTWERTMYYHAMLGRVVGTPAMDTGVAGAVGDQVQPILDAISNGNLREQMTVLFNFGRGLGAEILEQKRNGKADEVADFLDGMDLRAAKLSQRLGRLNNKNRYLISESRTGEVGKQKNTRGQDGNDQDKWKSERTVEESAKQGVELSEREVAHMRLDPENLANDVLTWEEGNRKWLINEADAWVQKVREVSLPIKAGPSGTTDRLMQARAMLGVSNPIAMRAACIGYLLPINAHSLIEILEAASQYSCPKPVYGPAVYAEILPFQGLELLAPTPEFWNACKPKVDKEVG